MFFNWLYTTVQLRYPCFFNQPFFYQFSSCKKNYLSFQAGKKLKTKRLLLLNGYGSETLQMPTGFRYVIKDTSTGAGTGTVYRYCKSIDCFVIHFKNWINIRILIRRTQIRNLMKTNTNTVLKYRYFI